MEQLEIKEEVINEEEFKMVINDIKLDINTTRLRAIREVNTELILLYFRIVRC